MFVMPTLSDRPFSGRAAWIGSNLPVDADVLRLTRDSLDEITRLARVLEDNPLPAQTWDDIKLLTVGCRGRQGDTRM
jgi:hypothetical protein